MSGCELEKQVSRSSMLPSQVPVLPGRRSVSHKLRGVGFNAEERVVRELAAVARVIADLGNILLSEDRDQGAVQVEDQARAVLGLMDEGLQQSIV